MIYLDHNATTPIAPEVLEAMTRAARDFPGNPASQHQLGQRARRQLERCREEIAEAFGADVTSLRGDQLLFTSGGTEANNLALLGLGIADPAIYKITQDRLLVSAIEHPSIRAAALHLKTLGADLQIIPVDETCKIKLEQVASLLADKSHLKPRLVSVMLASNETGALQPMADLACKCREFGVLLHTDAVQAAGKIDVSLKQLGVDALSITPHKFYGPLGIGALLVREGVKLAPQLFGGFQQTSLRPGTESVMLAEGFRAAVALYQQEAADRLEHLRSLRDQLARLLCDGDRAAVVHCAGTPQLPQTLSIAFPGVDRQKLVIAVDLQGVAISSGSACASGSSEPSPTLLAMGLSQELVESTVRLSVGRSTTPAEIKEAARRILFSVNNLRVGRSAGQFSEK